MTGKISIIIPVYNAAKYLDKCLNSVLSQTYTNLQIILVNDGSTDGSAEICDGYAGKDPRIQVIHQENKGVASARNVGLAAAVGEWIGFVDADDWIETDMFSYLLDNAERDDADTVVCAWWEELPQSSVPRGVDDRVVMTGNDTLEMLLHDELVTNYLWNKLWKRELFTGIRFPEGRTFEDVAVVYLLFERSSSVVCLPECKYHYLHHGGSVLDRQKLENKINFYYAAKNRMEDLQTRYTKYEKLLQASCVASAVGVWAAYCFDNREERLKYESILQEIADFSRKHRFLVWKHMKLGVTGKIIVGLTAHNCLWAFWIAGILGRIYRIKHGRNI